MKPVDLDAALEKASAGYPRVPRHELAWLIRDLVAELRAARQVIALAPRPPTFNTSTREYVDALAAYDQLTEETPDAV